MKKLETINQVRDDSDHDMLIKLDTKLERVISDIKELKDGISSRLEIVEKEKLSILESDKYRQEAEDIHRDHETRIRTLEQWKWILAGGLVIISLVLQPLVTRLLTLFVK